MFFILYNPENLYYKFKGHSCCITKVIQTITPKNVVKNGLADLHYLKCIDRYVITLGLYCSCIDTYRFVSLVQWFMS